MEKSDHTWGHSLDLIRSLQNILVAKCFASKLMLWKSGEALQGLSQQEFF